VSKEDWNAEIDDHYDQLCHENDPDASKSAMEQIRAELDELVDASRGAGQSARSISSRMKAAKKQFSTLVSLIFTNIFRF
jgi:hypothetical protein